MYDLDNMSVTSNNEEQEGLPESDTDDHRILHELRQVANIQDSFEGDGPTTQRGGATSSTPMLPHVPAHHDESTFVEPEGTFEATTTSPTASSTMAGIEVVEGERGPTTPRGKASAKSSPTKSSPKKRHKKGPVEEEHSICRFMSKPCTQLSPNSDSPKRVFQMAFGEMKRVVQQKMYAYNWPYSASSFRYGLRLYLERLGLRDLSIPNLRALSPHRGPQRTHRRSRLAEFLIGGPSSWCRCLEGQADLTSTS